MPLTESLISFADKDSLPCLLFECAIIMRVNEAAQLKEAPALACSRFKAFSSDLPPKPTRHSIAPGQVNWYQACLERMKPWLVHLKMAKYAFKWYPWHPLEVE